MVYAVVDAFSRFIVAMAVFPCKEAARCLWPVWERYGRPCLLRVDRGREASALVYGQLLSGGDVYAGQSTSNQPVEATWRIVKQDIFRDWSQVLWRLKARGWVTHDCYENAVLKYILLPLIQASIDRKCAGYNATSSRGKQGFSRERLFHDALNRCLCALLHLSSDLLVLILSYIALRPLLFVASVVSKRWRAAALCSVTALRIPQVDLSPAALFLRLTAIDLASA